MLWIFERKSEGEILVWRIGGNIGEGKEMIWKKGGKRRKRIEDEMKWSWIGKMEDWGMLVRSIEILKRFEKEKEKVLKWIKELNRGKGEIGWSKRIEIVKVEELKKEKSGCKEVGRELKDCGKKRRKKELKLIGRIRKRIDKIDRKKK